MKPAQIAKWFNAIGDAWNQGRAPFAYVNGQSEAVRVWSDCHGAGGDVDAADAALVAWATRHGVGLRGVVR